MATPLKIISDVTAPFTSSWSLQGPVNTRDSDFNAATFPMSPTRYCLGIAININDFSTADAAWKLIDKDFNIKARVPVPASVGDVLFESFAVPINATQLLVIGILTSFGTMDSRAWLVTFDESTGGGTAVEVTGAYLAASLVPQVLFGGQIDTRLDKNGLMLLPGAFNALDGSTQDDTMVIFDSSTGRITRGASPGLAGSRVYMAVAPLPDGRWLCTRQSTFAGSLAVASQIYDPATNVFAAGPDFPTTDPTAPVAASKDGLFVSTANGSGATWYLPFSTMIWESRTARPLAERAILTVALPDGRFLSLGAQAGTAANRPRCYVYDATTDTWTRLADYLVANAAPAVERPWLRPDGTLWAISLGSTLGAGTNGFGAFVVPGIVPVGIDVVTATGLHVIPKADPGARGVVTRLGDPILGPFASFPGLGADKAVRVIATTNHTLEGG